MGSRWSRKGKRSTQGRQAGESDRMGNASRQRTFCLTRGLLLSRRLRTKSATSLMTLASDPGGARRSPRPCRRGQPCHRRPVTPSNLRDRQYDSTARRLWCSLHDGTAANEEEGACADTMAPRLPPTLANLGEISSPSPNHRSPLVRSSPGDGAGVRSLCGSVTALLRKCGIDEVGREWRRADLHVRLVCRSPAS
jgi:hypothetical protein